jgi:hypothetical protein
MKAENVAPEGHPVHTLISEHNSVLDFTDKLIESAEELAGFDSFAEANAIVSRIAKIIDHFKSAQKHYLREENILFPYLEKHGITGPIAQMWNEHDQIRETEKYIFDLMGKAFEMELKDFAEQMGRNASALADLLATHYHKENNILFPMAMKLFSEKEWSETNVQFSEIGYCCFSPKRVQTQAVSSSETRVEKSDGNMIDTGSGKLTVEQLTAMLNTLPVEITFVDKDDTFNYFNKVDDPIFVRTVASVGTKVQNCHPQKSVHLVNQILADFKSGAKDEVSFWIDFKSKYVYIRYFAVRDQQGNYLGCMEVTQDIKGIKNISGEKRLV